MRITTPGTYRLFVRASGYDSVSDSVFASIAEIGDGPGGAADWYRYVLGAEGSFAGVWEGRAGFESIDPCCNGH